MILKLQPAVLCMTVTLSLGLSACGGSKAASGDTSDRSSQGPTLADGPDVCFRAIAKHLAADTKVSEITSLFSVGSEIESYETKPAGEMTNCSVEYQSPDDPRKLLSTQLNIDSGEFDPPRPVEITPVGGNAAEFKLEDYLIPLSKINAAPLASIMDAQKAKLGGVYSRYAWSAVRLSAPGSFANKHSLRLDVEGRLASNDIKKDGYAEVTTDGKTITSNRLIP